MLITVMVVVMMIVTYDDYLPGKPNRCSTASIRPFQQCENGGRGGKGAGAGR